MIQKALITAGLNKATKKASTPKDNKLRNNIIFGVVVVAGVIITAKIFKKQLAIFIQKRKEENELNKEIKGKGTLQPSQYRDLANGIQKAFQPYETFGAGTDETAIYNIFRMLKNNDDFLILKQTYGIRPYVDYTINPFGTTTNLNMQQAILAEDEGSVMKNYINNILKVKGISYRL